MASVIEEDDIDWSMYQNDSDARAKVRPASAYADELETYFSEGQRKYGDYLPWAKCEDDIRLRPGEVSAWVGINGHGKSLVTGLTGLGLMRQNRRSLVASMEMKPRATLARMCRQASQSNAPTSEFVRRFAQWTDGKLWLYDQQDTVESGRILALCRYASQELGIHHVFIDSLMKCIRGEDDYNAQKDFVNALTTIARDTQMHIHLVHHVRKGASEANVPGKFDLKGSGSIADQVDNVFIVWRNKEKQFDRQQNKAVDEETPDALLTCEKQRNGEWEGKVALWYLPNSMQYVERPGQGPQTFMRAM
jgi:twinkle protein